MNNFKFWNNLLGWLVFVVAATTYLLTLEPTVSFWDCGEFASTAFKLEVGHPPGAPLYLMLARVFSLFALRNEHVAWAINSLSAVSSALAVMFLFWTLSRLFRKVFSIVNNELNFNSLLFLLASALAALTFAFTDSFWFSAVEAEVYASSLLFTSLVFWLILKWGDAKDELYAVRWLLLIVFLIGLSVGVHLLNLLVIPVLVIYYYFERYRVSVKGFLLAMFAGVSILGIAQFILIPGVVKMAVWFELFFTNSLHFPYHTGTFFYLLCLFAVLFTGIWLGQKFNYRFVYFGFLSVSLFLLGYSSYSVLVIRSNTDTPLNEGNPNSVFSLLNYLNREQYGSRPLIYGQNYNAPIVETLDGTPVYVKAKGRYEVSYRYPQYKYDSRYCTFFPRMYSSDPDHIDVYKSWGEVKGKPVRATSNEKAELENSPTLSENLRFFFTYQMYYMYLRYFMWNFSGRQNDYDGNGGIMKGNFLTGISFVDNALYGPQDKLPDYMKHNQGRNRYFLLPLLFGLIGLIYLLTQNRPVFVSIFILFIMTGLAIVVYLNQTPLQPRERDYAYVGSFYAFSIWIGFGIFAAANFISKLLRNRKILCLIVSFVCFGFVPLIVFAQNINDHNRSKRYITRAVAYNYLNSCAPNAILFTDGDNDTFPLWYLQEVEGIRTDVRVVNLMLLNSDWYINQMRRKLYLSDKLPISLDSSKYLEGRLSYVYLSERQVQAMSFDEAIKYVASDEPPHKIELESGEKIDYLPSKSFYTLFNKNVKDSTIPNSWQFAPDTVFFKINRGYFPKSDLVVMDILAHNNWKRPIYFVSSGAVSLGLDEYLQLEGFAYRLSPIKSSDGKPRIASDKMYDNIMNRFVWGNMNDSDVLIDDIQRRTAVVMRIRQNMAGLTHQLLSEGKPDSARKVIRKCVNLMPATKFPHDAYSFPVIEAAIDAKEIDLAKGLISEYSTQSAQMLAYIGSMPRSIALLNLYEQNVAKRNLSKLEELRARLPKVK